MSHIKKNILTDYSLQLLGISAITALLIWVNTDKTLIILSFFIYCLFVFSTFYTITRKDDEILSKLVRIKEASIFAMAYQAEQRDEETGIHLMRTTKYVKILGEELKKTDKYKFFITDKYMEDLMTSAPLHDIGKIGISDSILLKPGKLTKEEFQEMKGHCEIGANTLRVAQRKLGIHSFFEMATEIVLTHHERWDGKGYPKGLRGDEIPLAGRIMALADIYDTLRSKRSYKEEFSHQKAMEIILSEKGKALDPKIVNVFMMRNNEFYEISTKLKDSPYNPKYNKGLKRNGESHETLQELFAMET